MFEWEAGRLKQSTGSWGNKNRAWTRCVSIAFVVNEIAFLFIVLLGFSPIFQEERESSRVSSYSFVSDRSKEFDFHSSLSLPWRH